MFKFCQLSKTQWMLEGLEMYVHSKAFQDTSAIVPKSQVLLQDRIYNVYTRYILYIYHAKVMFEPS